MYKCYYPWFTEQIKPTFSFGDWAVCFHTAYVPSTAMVKPLIHCSQKYNKETLMVKFFTKCLRTGQSLAEKKSEAPRHMSGGWLSGVSSQLAALEEGAAFESTSMAAIKAKPKRWWRDPSLAGAVSPGAGCRDLGIQSLYNSLLRCK